MSAIVSPEASSLLKPDPPLDIQLSKDKTVEQTSLVDDSVGDKSGDLLNYEHEEEEEDDEDELEALRMAALQSRKPKKPEQPAYTLKQHPSRNNLTQIVLSGPERPSQQSHSINHAVPLPDTSRPPPGYTPVSIPPLPLHGSAYGVGQIPPVPSTLTIPQHPPHIVPHNPSLIHHHESVYHSTDYYDYGREKSRYISSHHEYRDRSPEFRDRERRMSPYERNRQYTEKYYKRSDSPGYRYSRSPGKERDIINTRRPSREYSKLSETMGRVSKFSRYNSGSEQDDSESSEEEVEEEIEVTATESEDDNESNANIKTAECMKNGENENTKEKGVKGDVTAKTKPSENELNEADDVLNVDCTEEVDEFTSFLNEFEDELKEKPKKEKTLSTSTNKKEQNNSSNAEGKRKKTKIVKRIVKRPKRKRKFMRISDSRKESDSTNTQEDTKNSENLLQVEKRWSPKRYSRSPYRSDGYSQKRYPTYSHVDDYKRSRQRTPTLSPEPQDKKLRFNPQRKINERSRSPHKKSDAEVNEKVTDSKSKSLPPPRALSNSRRSNSRGAISQSRDADVSEKDTQKREKETPEEKEDREFAEKLKRASTQEERDRLLARRQKFRNVQPIELTKKVISLKSKEDDRNYEEPLNEKRLRNKNKQLGVIEEMSEADAKMGEKPLSVKSRMSITSRLPSETGDAISLNLDDTLDMFEGEVNDRAITTSKSKGIITDLRLQLSKKRQEGMHKESSSINRDARHKLSKSVGKAFDSIKRNNADSEEDNLDPLEKATVEDVSPRTIRQLPDRYEDNMTRDKSRLVLRDASRLRGRKIEAFTSEENAIINESLQEYSDEENILNPQTYGGVQRGSRISVMDRLGKPVHKEKTRRNASEEYNDQYTKSDDTNDFDYNTKGNIESADLESHQPSDTDLMNNKKSKKDKREKKDKKEKKKLKELKKLEKKLKKLKAKKRHKSSEKYASEESETDSYDDKIEYFMSEEDEKEVSHKQPEGKKLKHSKGPKTSGNKKNATDNSNSLKKKYEKEDDSDDELFAFFEKDDGDVGAKTVPIIDKKNESKGKSNIHLASKVSAAAESDIQRKKDTSKLKPGSSKDSSNLMSKMKKKSDKTLKRMKEIEEDRLVHR